MRTKDLVEQIEQPPMDKRTCLWKNPLRGICKKASSSMLSKAAAALEKDYRENKALPAFTAIDMDGFDEAR